MKSQIPPFYWSKRNKPGVDSKKTSLKYPWTFTVLILALVGIQTCFPPCLKAHGRFGFQERFSSTEKEPKVELVVQTSLRGFVSRKGSFSKDGKFVVTTDGNGVILWTVGGRKIRRIDGKAESISSAVFSPDTRFVLVGAEKTARLWDTATGKEFLRFEGHTDWINDVDYSHDGKLVATASEDSTIRLWDAGTGQLRQIIKGHYAGVSCIDFSPDGRFLASGGGYKENKVVEFDGYEEKSARLWDVKTGKEIRRFKGHESYINDCAFSPDSRFLATASQDYTARVWNIETGKEVQRFTLKKEDFKELDKENELIFDKNSLEKARLLNKSNGILCVDFSPDGKQIATGSGNLQVYYKHDTSARVWSVETGMQILRLSHGAQVQTVGFSSDGKCLLTTEDNFYYYAPSHLWDLKTGGEVARYDGYAERIDELSIPPQGGMVFVKSGNPKTWWRNDERGDSLQIWDCGKLGGVRLIVRDQKNTLSEDLSSDGKFLLCSTWVRTPKNQVNSIYTLFTISNNQLKEVWKKEGFSDGCFSPNGDAVLCHNTKSDLYIFETETGRQLKKFENISGTIDWISSDGEMLGTKKENKGLIWSLKDGKLFKEFVEKDGHIFSFRISPNKKWAITTNSSEFSIGKREVVRNKKGSMRLWDIASGKEQYCIFGDAIESWAKTIFLLDVSFDGKYILTNGAFQGNHARLWDLYSGKEVKQFESFENDSIIDACFSPDGNLVLIGTESGITSIRNLQTGQELCRLISFFDGTWVVTTPDGRFDTNNLETIRGLYWVISDDPMNPLPVDTFAREYYEPRLLPRVLAGEVLPPIPSVASLNRAVPKVSISEIRRTAAGSDKVLVTVEVANGTLDVTRNGTVVRMESGAQDVRLFRDGQLVGYQDGKVTFEPSAGTAKITFSNIDLPRRADQSQVEFAAYAFNQDHVKSETVRSWIAIPSELKPRSRRAYLISLGVNTNSQPKLELRYAANDARRFQAAVGEQLLASGEFEDVVRIPLLSERASNATSETDQAVKANLKAVLDLLAGKSVSSELIQSIPGANQIRQAHPEDLVMITFSGHGVANDQGIFYFVPSDTGTEPLLSEGFLKRCISSDELSAWLRNVDAGDLTLIVDACQSAALVDSNGFKPGPIGSRGLGQLSYDKGMRILAATQSDNVALESQSIQQGLLSYALTQEGLTERKADFNPQDRVISLTEWLMYGAERVPDLHQAMLDRQLPEGTRLLRYRAAEPDLKLQQPQFFDFSRKTRDLILVRK